MIASQVGRSVCSGGLWRAVTFLSGPVMAAWLLVMTPLVTASTFWQVNLGDTYCHILTNGTQSAQLSAHSGHCVTDGENVPHTNNELCIVEALQPLYATATYFDTESYYDYVRINNTGPYYSAQTGPMNRYMNAGDTFIWTSDISMARGGFTICASIDMLAAPPEAPPPPPPNPRPPSPSLPTLAPAMPTAAGQMWHILTESGNASTFCHLSNNGTCVTDGIGPHDNNEYCTFQAAADLYAHATYFNTEATYDYISINGTRYSGFAGPQNVFMSKGDQMFWRADYSLSMGGFEVCAYVNPQPVAPSMPPPPPPAPSPPPPAPPPPTPPVSPTSIGPLWTITSGSQFCNLDSVGHCITDGIGDHGSNEACEASVTRAVYVAAQYFNTESNYDFVTITSGGTPPTVQQFSGTAGPLNVFMDSAATLRWNADYSINNGGFIICASATGPFVIPPPPPLPPPPSPLPPAPSGAMFDVQSGDAFCHLESNGTVTQHDCRPMLALLPSGLRLPFLNLISPSCGPCLSSASLTAWGSTETESRAPLWRCRTCMPRQRSSQPRHIGTT